MDASGHAKPHTLARRLKVTAVALGCSLVALVVAAVFLGKQAQLVRESMAGHTALGGWVGRDAALALVQTDSGEHSMEQIRGDVENAVAIVMTRRSALNARVAAGSAATGSLEIVKLAQEPISIGDQAVIVGASIGVACNADAEGGWKALLARADEMVYRAKDQGRGRYVLAAQEDSQLPERQLRAS